MTNRKQPFAFDYLGNKVVMGDIILYPFAYSNSANQFKKAIFCYINKFEDGERRIYEKDKQYKTFTKVEIKNYGNSIYSRPRKSCSSVPFIKITEDNLTDVERRNLHLARDKAGV